MKKVVLLLLLFAALFISGCREKEKPQPVQQPVQVAPDELVVVSTNDFHGALDRAEGLASVIRDLRKKYREHMVYLDAGDQFQGSLESNITKGRAVIEFFNLLGLDAAALGNHELDYGPDVPGRVTVLPNEDGMGNLTSLLKILKYPMISANFVSDPIQSCATPGPYCNALRQQTILQPRVIFQRGGKKVCVAGATTAATGNITNPDFIRGKRFLDPEPIVAAEAKWLRETEKCDWLLLNIHEGLRYEPDGKTLKKIALLPILEHLPHSTFDAVIGGHSHVQVQTQINGMPIIQTGTAAKVVGVLHLKRMRDRVSFRFDPFVPVPDTAVAFDVTKLLLPYRQRALEQKRHIVGSTVAPFPQDKTAESALGNLMADAVLDAAKERDPDAQFSLMNGGGIRSDLPAGKISYDNVFKLMPFNNSLVVVNLAGSELRLLLEVAFSGALGMPSVSGLRVKVLNVQAGEQGPWSRDLNGDGMKEDWERNLLVDARDEKGRIIEDIKRYKLTTNSFLVEGGDYQDLIYEKILPTSIRIYEGTLIRDILAQYFSAHSPLNPAKYYTPAKARIKLVSPK